jgi:hypothetical protein
MVDAPGAVYRGGAVHGDIQDAALKGVPDVTTDTTMSSGRLAGRDQAATGQPVQGAGQAVQDSAAFVARQLGGALAIIVLVWLVVMLFRHVQPVALALAGVVIVLGGGMLFLRNQSLRRDTEA